MPLFAARDSDLGAAAALVNSAYRGESSRQGWTTEADYLDGQRTSEADLRQDLAANPAAQLYLFRGAADQPLLGVVWLEPAGGEAWFLGMLTVRPELQDRGLGRRMLDDAETLVRGQGGRRLRMTVVSIRDTLIAWYARRGYLDTGETKPFPYQDRRFGDPKRDDLAFVVLEKVLF